MGVDVASNLARIDLVRVNGSGMLWHMGEVSAERFQTACVSMVECGLFCLTFDDGRSIMVPRDNLLSAVHGVELPGVPKEVGTGDWRDMRRGCVGNGGTVLL